MSRRGLGAETLWKGVAHARIRHDVLDSPAWRALPFSARALYSDLRRKLNSYNNGNLECTPVDMSHRGWRSKTTLYQALAQLELMGFIAKTRQGGKGSLSKCCSLFRFTDLPCYEHPKQGLAACKATLDWRAFTTVADAEAAIDRLAAKTAAGRKKSKGQKMSLSGPEFVRQPPFAGPNSGLQPISGDQNLAT